MFRVGDFARLGQTSVKALHHYDDIGLLRPSQVDASTGYRYYAPAQLRDLARVLTLKELGFSLAQIGPLLQADLPAGQIEALLRLKQAELTERVRIEQERLDLVTRRLRRIEQGGSLGSHEIQVKAVPEQKVLALRRTLEADSDPQAIGNLIGDGFRRLYKTLGAHRLRPAGPSVVYWDEIRKGDEGGDILLTIPVADALLDTAQTGDVFMHLLPAVSQMASITYHGPLRDVEGAYLALIAWIDENDFRICGPHRDVVLHYAGDPEGDSVNEAQFPVSRDAQQ